MLAKKIEHIFSSFKSFYNLNFAINEFDDNHVILQAADIDIIVTYDEIEDDIYFDFDLSKYLNSEDFLSDLQFPIYLNLKAIYFHLNILFPDSMNIKNLSLDERLKIQFKEFKIIWMEIVKHENYIQVLLKMLIKERIKLKELNLKQNLEATISKAHSFFKSKDYEKVVSLLEPQIEFLNHYDFMIFKYSVKKVNNNQK